MLPELRPAFRETGRILADVAIAVAGACDAMLAAKRRRETEADTEGGEGEGGKEGSSAKEAAATTTTTTTTKAATTTEAATTTTTEAATITLRSLIESGEAAKGRLLYYYPRGQRNASSCGGGGEEEGAAEDAAASASESGEEQGGDEEEEDSWCGWHVDSGALTALVRAMFLDPQDREVEDPGPGSGAGLYVRPRRGWRHRRSSTCGGEIETDASEDGEQQEEAPAVRVSIPEGCVAVQAGEAAQVFSGGSIVATPHCVRGIGKKTETSRSESNTVSRATFALFMQPRWDAPLEPSRVVFVGGGGGEKGGGERELLHSPASVGVARWRPGDTFGDFTERTFDAYYK